jgi:hypothetical protein
MYPLQKNRENNSNFSVFYSVYFWIDQEQHDGRIAIGRNCLLYFSWAHSLSIGSWCVVFFVCFVGCRTFLVSRVCILSLDVGFWLPIWISLLQVGTVHSTSQFQIHDSQTMTSNRCYVSANNNLFDLDFQLMARIIYKMIKLCDVLWVEQIEISS